jgi:hypothetical protein
LIKRNVNRDFSGYIANPFRKENIPQALVKLAAQIKKILLVTYKPVNANRYLQKMLGTSHFCTKQCFRNVFSGID